jgi:hypothetical protein
MKVHLAQRMQLGVDLIVFQCNVANVIRDGHSKDDIVATRADLFKDLDFLSEQLSDRSRKIAFGMLAIWWAFLIGDKHLTGMTAQAMLGPVALAASSICADFLQYAVALFYGNRLLKDIESNGQDTFQYDRKSLWYRGRQAFFFLKHLFAGAGLAWFVVLIFRSIILGGSQ